MSKDKGEPWIVTDESASPDLGMKCLGCGGNRVVRLPLSIEKSVKELDAFRIDHQKCKTMWVTRTTTGVPS